MSPREPGAPEPSAWRFPKRGGGWAYRTDDDHRPKQEPLYTLDAAEAALREQIAGELETWSDGDKYARAAAAFVREAASGEALTAIPARGDR